MAVWHVFLLCFITRIVLDATKPATKVAVRVEALGIFWCVEVWLPTDVIERPPMMEGLVRAAISDFHPDDGVQRSMRQY